MRKLIEFLTGRVFITGVLLIIQLAWVMLFWFKLTEYSDIIRIILELLSLAVVLYLVSSDDNPAYKIAWIIPVMALPVFGTLLYLSMGGKRPARRMREKLKKAENEIAHLLTQDDVVLERIGCEDMRGAGLSHYIASYGYPISDSTGVKYYPLGEEMYEDMLTELKNAQSYIFMEYFIIKPGKMWDGILEILKEKANQGVDVRLIFDDMGCLTMLPKDFVKTMESYGIKCLRFNPFIPLLSIVMNNRDHRKITVIDGHTAFNGGINLADEYINEIEVHGHWKDTGIKLYGEAVWNFTVMFLELWNAFKKENEDIEIFKPHYHHAEKFQSDGYVQPFSDTPLDDENLSVNVYTDILAQANDYVYIFTPYLIIDDVMNISLSMAAKRGVDVRIVTPGIPDMKTVYRLTQSHYESLIKAGVRIYEYTPGFIHAKSYVSDDIRAIVGTINMDYRSLYLHFECGTYIYKSAAVMDLKRDALSTFEISREIKLEDCRKGMLNRVIDSVLRLFAPLT